MTLDNCEVSSRTLRVRLAAGEPYSKARKLRNFIVCGKKYASLWELSKDTAPQLTYQQLKYRVCVLKMPPTQAVYDMRNGVLQKRELGRAIGTPLCERSPLCALSHMNPTS
jgi:hypothetical protein